MLLISASVSLKRGSLFERSNYVEMMMKNLLRYSLLCGIALALTLAISPAKVFAQSPPPNVLVSGNGYLPAQGYQWVTNVPGDFRVKWVGLSGGQGQAGQALAAPAPDREAMVKALAKVLSAWVAHASSAPRQGDGFVEFVLRDTARAARNELLDSALSDVFPASTGRSRQGMRQLIVMGMERRTGNQEVTRQQILSELRQRDSELADSAEVVNFIIKAIQAQ